MYPLHFDNTGKEDGGYPLFNEVYNVTMCYLDGKTGFRNNTLNSFVDTILMGFIRKDNLIAQFCEKGVKEGKEFMQEHTLWNTYCRSPRGRGVEFPADLM